jgi:hypothetical protein
MLTYMMQLSSSQKLALVDALLELIRIPGTTQTFVDCSKTPAVETSVTDLLKLVTESVAYQYVRGEPENENAGPAVPKKARQQ